MKILIIKTSSMGDVIHTLPAVTDIYKHFGNNVKIDWVIEESFIDIIRYHQAVNQVIPLALRRWRKELWRKENRTELLNFIKKLRENEYDYVIDAQGLLKSAIITKSAKLSKQGACYGLDKKSARGKYLSNFYQHQIAVSKKMHAIVRLREFCSKVFKYDYEQTKLDYGLTNSNYAQQISEFTLDKPYLVFLHCTTWSSKQWPVDSWQQLAQIAIDQGYHILFNSGNRNEYHKTLELVEYIKQECQQASTMAIAMPPQSLADLSVILAKSSAVVAVDTGLGHMAAALDKPGVGIFGATNTVLTGFLSDKFINLSSDYKCSPCLLKNCNQKKHEADSPPCYAELSPQKVWGYLIKTITSSTSKFSTTS